MKKRKFNASARKSVWKIFKNIRHENFADFVHLCITRLIARSSAWIWCFICARCGKILKIVTLDILQYFTCIFTISILYHISQQKFTIWRRFVNGLSFLYSNTTSLNLELVDFVYGVEFQRIEWTRQLFVDTGSNNEWKESTCSFYLLYTTFPPVLIVYRMNHNYPVLSIVTL